MSQRDKPRLALNNNTAGVCEREETNRTRVAGHLDEIQGVTTSSLESFRNGAVGFIDWLGLLVESRIRFGQELDFRKRADAVPPVDGTIADVMLAVSALCLNDGAMR